MDRVFYVKAVAMAERHVAQGHKHISKQRQIIANFEERGIDSIDAKSLLDTFLATQKLFEDDWRRYIIELSKFGNSDTDRP